MALNRAADPEWQRAEYARVMGQQALERQAHEAAKALARRNAICQCRAINEFGGNQIGPHHDLTCPRWARAREE